MSKSDNDNENEIHLSFYVPAETRRALMVLAAIQGMKLTPYVRRLLVEHAQEQSPRIHNIVASNRSVEASLTKASVSSGEAPAPAPAPAQKVSSPPTPKDIAKADVTDMNFDEIGDLLKSLP